ncbi:MAG: DEAD/DEAH box helicase [Planctomycetes bacterium]|nr:DEAD/DEAH box helicase [Planctomycetota bacterium]
MSFSSLGLPEPILAGIREAGYESPTDIQRQAIPIVLAGKNLIALGETGSGKTAAFGLPMLARLLDDEPGLRAIILVPTRELCVQVAENLRTYASHSDIKVCTAFGGIPITIQEAAFRRGLDVLVACPGRLIDHISCGNLELARVRNLVLDEADRMLDMGFIPQIQRILSFLPNERQNCLFSATMPPEIERLVKDYVGEAERVQIGKRSQAAKTITHEFEELRADEKERRLEKLLRRRDDRVLIFVKRKTGAETLGRQLKRAGLPADSIHGDKGAEQRHVVLRAFERGKIKHLVATDVAARGIDVSEIGLVVNYDMPMALEDYIHRVGRTGRAGDTGRALSFITRLDKRLMKQIIDHLRSTADVPPRIVVNGEDLTPRGGRGRREEGRERDRAESRDEGREDRGRRRRRGGRGDDIRDDDRGRDRRDERRPERPVERDRSEDESRPRDRNVAASRQVRLTKRKSGDRDEASDVIWGAESEPEAESSKGSRRRRRGR